MLRIFRDGLYTVLEAEAPDIAGLCRLWVHGGGKSTYLGTMQPENGGLVLRRRLTRRELARFPDPIEFASDREQEETTKDLHNKIDIKETGPEQETDEKETRSVENKEEEGEENLDRESLHNQQTDYSSCPWPAEPPETGLTWFSRGDGSLTAFDGISSLLALPAALRTPNARTVERVIEGKKYLVFRY